MYPVAVENRESTTNLPNLNQGQPQPQHTLQVHMHHVCCPCSNSVIYPYYPGYRPTPHPLLQPPSIPRPSYLHHYQYTQFQVNNSPFNVPFTPSPLPLQGYNQPTVDVAFGPPPRDRRNLEHEDTSEPPQLIVSEEESFIEFLVKGCLAGERIAKRNEHRPCFKNIQNLCSRTRSEVAKPNITVSNIHSQGVPWATKDFIFAFVRAVNCWSILRGYLGLTTPSSAATSCGGLGKVDREISPGFRQCYIQWEQRTKELAHHLVETFCKLDEVNSSPLETDGTRGKIVRERVVYDKDVAALKGIPGILHIPLAAEFREMRHVTTDPITDLSPHCEDSDNEGRIYMKPGSYSVPTLTSRNKPNVTIEFLETAQNITSQQRKFIDLIDAVAADRAWQTAQNITPEFIKQNEEPPLQTKAIQQWLNGEFNESQDYNDIFKSSNAEATGGLESTSSILTKRKPNNDFMDKSFTKTYSNYRRNFSNSNYELQNGILNDSPPTPSVVLKELDRGDSESDYTVQSADENDLSPFNLGLVWKKLREGQYRLVNKVVTSEVYSTD